MESHVSSFISAVNVMNDLPTSLFRRHFDRSSTRIKRKTVGYGSRSVETRPLED
jgi:hypothetical protein